MSAENVELWPMNRPGCRANGNLRGKRIAALVEDGFEQVELTDSPRLLQSVSSANLRAKRARLTHEPSVRA
jgi:hypothetical protein